MTQSQIITYWQKGAQDALETAEALFKAKKYHFCLFFCQLSLEKSLKAKVVTATKEYTTKWFTITKELLQWLSQK